MHYTTVEIIIRLDKGNALAPASMRASVRYGANQLHAANPQHIPDAALETLRELLTETLTSAAGYPGLVGDLIGELLEQRDLLNRDKRDTVIEALGDLNAAARRTDT